MTQQQQDRQRIFSHITRSRFLHVEDSLSIGKIRFFIGEYRKGEGAQATAYHFLDADDARVIMADLGWGRQVDIKDFKGSAANGGQAVSRVLTIRGPKEGKFWFQIDNGPGQVIGAGAVKPAGDPTASISIALPTHDARALALAVIEYMAAWRVAALCSPSPSPKVTPSVLSNKTPMASPGPPPMPKVGGRTVDHQTGEIADAEALFGQEKPVGAGLAPAPVAPAPIAPAPKAQEEPPAEVDPPTFFRLANKAIAAGFDLPKLQEIINGPEPYREKHIALQAAMSPA